MIDLCSGLVWYTVTCTFVSLHILTIFYSYPILQSYRLIDSIPKDLNRPWEDPLPEAGERHFAQELRSINMSSFDGAPEWKQKAESKTLSYGIISNKSIKEQREGLPVYRLKPELIRAISENQV